MDVTPADRSGARPAPGDPLDRLDDLEDAELAEHVTVFESIHERLSARLRTAER